MTRLINSLDFIVIAFVFFVLGYLVNRTPRQQLDCVSTISNAEILYIQSWMDDLNSCKPNHVRLIGNGLWRKEKYVID